MVHWVPAVSVALVVALTPGCSMFGPTTVSEVCAEFDELGDRFVEVNGFADNSLFSQAGDLADVAGRYDGTPSLSADADALEEISDSDSTTGFELMAATGSIASLCGRQLGEGVSPFGEGGISLGEQDQAPEQTGQAVPDEGTTAAPVPTATTAPSSADHYAVSGPGGLSVSIPSGWIVGGSPSAANQQASDPSDPQSFVRFGASAQPAVPLLTEIQAGERENPNVQNGYQRIQLVETYFLGQAAVDWEFTFIKEGVTRHALGRYWRQAGLGYVIYLSTPDSRWFSLRSIFDEMADTVVIH